MVVNNKKNPPSAQYKCARALYKDQYADFALGMSTGPFGGGLNLAARGWAKDLAKDPAHITIVPFLGGVPDPCTPSGCS